MIISHAISLLNLAAVLAPQQQHLLCVFHDLSYFFFFLSEAKVECEKLKCVTLIMQDMFETTENAEKPTILEVENRRVVTLITQRKFS
jgi:hypothetical protein